MTDRNSIPDDVLAQLHDHTAIDLNATDDLLYHDDRVYIVHEPGEVTRVSIAHPDTSSVRVAGIVRITSDRPRISPADDVIAVGRITHIVHGPGRETRVLP